MGTILGIVCIVLGFVSAFVSAPILFPPLVWFVAAIAFAVVLNGVALPALVRKG
jgi:hypothetical protein